MLFIVICLVVITLCIMMFGNTSAPQKDQQEICTTTSNEGYSVRKSAYKSENQIIIKQKQKAQKEAINVTEEIRRSSIIIDYAFFVETIVHEWRKMEAKIAQLEKFERMDGIKISMSASQVESEGIKQYNEGILKAIQRQFDGYKWVIPFLKARSDVALYTQDMYERIEYAKSSTITFDNQMSVLDSLEDIRANVDDFCSSFISVSEKECMQNAKKLIGYCNSLNILSIKLFKEKKDSEALKVLTESGINGNSCANRDLWDYFKEHPKYANNEHEPLYRLCTTGAIISYRHAQKAIAENRKYKSKILLAMAYGVGVDDYTDVPKGDYWEWPEDQKGTRPIEIYRCPFEGAYNFRMNRFVELSSHTKYDGYYYYDMETIKVRRRKNN